MCFAASQVLQEVEDLPVAVGAAQAAVQVPQAVVEVVQANPQQKHLQRQGRDQVL